MKRIQHQEVGWNDEGNLKLHEAKSGLCMKQKVEFAWSKKGHLQKGFRVSFLGQALHLVEKSKPLYGPIRPTQHGQILGTFWMPNVGSWTLFLMIDFCHLKFWADHKSVTSQSLSSLCSITYLISIFLSFYELISFCLFQELQKIQKKRKPETSDSRCFKLCYWQNQLIFIILF